MCLPLTSLSYLLLIICQINKCQIFFISRLSHRRNAVQQGVMCFFEYFLPLQKIAFLSIKINRFTAWLVGWSFVIQSMIYESTYPKLKVDNCYLKKNLKVYFISKIYNFWFLVKLVLLLKITFRLLDICRKIVNFVMCNVETGGSYVNHVTLPPINVFHIQL